MSEHTPGRWEVKDKDTGKMRIVSKDDPKVCIADIPHWAEKHWRERNANAELIAAAPHMLLALETMHEAWKTGRNEPMHQAIKLWVEPAIQKARKTE